MGKKIAASAAAVAVLLTAAIGMAGEADVVADKAAAEGGGSYRFEVTVRHADAGWDHYADRFEVLTTEGEVIGVRTLSHILRWLLVKCPG